jgi:hypothetical protein
MRSAHRSTAEKPGGNAGIYEETVMNESANIHTLAHHALNTLQSAYQNIQKPHVDGLILSAMVSVRHLHDLINPAQRSIDDVDPEEYCAAI